MRRLVVPLALVVCGCGGQSHAHREGAGGGGGAGGDGAAVSGTAGTPATCAEGGQAGASEFVPRPHDPARCEAYRAETDALAACRYIWPDCPADEATFLAALAKTDAGSWWVRTGCGVTEIGNQPTFGSTTLDFGPDGALIGYALSSDSNYGPCDAWSYEGGQHVPAACDAVRDCPLAQDAARADDVCACACPDSPPADGIADVTGACAAGGRDGCPHDLSMLEWNAFTLDHAANGSARYGCGQVAMTFEFASGTFECVYDASATLVGFTRTPQQPEACPGVVAWRSGTPYAECASETVCGFGADCRADLPPCGSYPYL